MSLKVKVRLRSVGFLWLDSNRDSWRCGHGLDIQPKSALLGLQTLEVQIVQSLLQDSFIYLFIYLFIWLLWVLVVACGI